MSRARLTRPASAPVPTELTDTKLIEAIKTYMDTLWNYSQHIDNFETSNVIAALNSMSKRRATCFGASDRSKYLAATALLHVMQKNKPL